MWKGAHQIVYSQHRDCVDNNDSIGPSMMTADARRRRYWILTLADEAQIDRLLA